MGIVCHCPNGHRIKVKDRFAGKRGLCPTCGATFRIGTARDGGEESFEADGTAEQAAENALGPVFGAAIHKDTKRGRLARAGKSAAAMAVIKRLGDVQPAHGLGGGLAQAEQLLQGQLAPFLEDPPDRLLALGELRELAGLRQGVDVQAFAPAGLLLSDRGRSGRWD